MGYFTEPATKSETSPAIREYTAWKGSFTLTGLKNEA